MHNSRTPCRCGLIQVYPRYVRKVPRGYRSAKLGRRRRVAGAMARMSRLRRCIRPPTQPSKAAGSPVAVARRAWMCVDAADVEGEGASPRTSRSVCTGECVSWSNPPHAPLNSTHFRQPSGPVPTCCCCWCELACLCPYLIIPPPRPEPALLLLLLSPPLLYTSRFAFCCRCCCCCCWVEPIAAPQTVLHPHTCRRSRLRHEGPITPARLRHYHRPRPTVHERHFCHRRAGIDLLRSTRLALLL